MGLKIAFCKLLIVLVTTMVIAEEKSWRSKNIQDMTDSDFEHLLDQWEENEEPLEPDELPEHLRPSPKIDLSQVDTTDPDTLLKVTKKGKGVMMFVDCKPNISEEEVEVITRIWQSSLQNNHIIAERYSIDKTRSIFMFREGSQAVDAKNYLLQQPQLYRLTLEGHTYYQDAQQQRKADEWKRMEANKRRRNEL